MKLPLHVLSLLLILVCLVSAEAQKRRTGPGPRVIGSSAVVLDETLSVLRNKPGLFTDTLQRMRRGRKVQILGVAEADGVRFFKVSVPPDRVGWVQSDAVFGKFRAGDEERLARVVHAADGFDQLELAAAFFELYPASKLRPPILLMFGDMLEDAAAKLSRDASSRLSRREMAASGAPIHSYYLNFNMIDRYRKLGVRFLFNSSLRRFHYDGASWHEIVRRHAASSEAIEAAKRIESLKSNLEKTIASQ